MISSLLNENDTSSEQNTDYAKVGEKVGKGAKKAIAIILKSSNKKSPKALKLLSAIGSLSGKLINLKKKKQLISKELPSKVTA